MRYTSLCLSGFNSKISHLTHHGKIPQDLQTELQLSFIAH